MEEENNTASVQITEADVEKLLDGAFEEFQTGRKAVAMAIGKAYSVWRLTGSLADPKWLQAKIDKYNEGIKRHNEAINDNDEIKTEDKKNFFKVPATASAGTSRFLATVKFIFRFDTHDQSSMANRYATAMEWAHRKFGRTEKSLALPQKVADRIMEEGGLMAIVKDQQDHEREQLNEKPTTKDEAKVREAVLEKKRSILRNREPLGSVSKGDVQPHNGLFLLIGRANGDKIDIVEVADVDEAAVDRVVSSGSRFKLTGTDKSTELLGRVLRLGEIVHEGKSFQKVSQDAGESDRHLDVLRFVSLRVNEAEKPEIMVSAVRSSASSVIRAVPKNGALTAANEPVYLRTRDRKRCETELGNPQRRWLYSTIFQQDPQDADGNPMASPLKMNLTAQAIPSASGGSVQHSYYWSKLKELKASPLVRSAAFKPQITFELHKKQIENIFVGFLSGWLDRKNKELKLKDRITVIVSKDEVRFTAKEAKPASIELNGESDKTCTLIMLAEDLVKLFDRLRETPAEKFTFGCVEDGALQVTWDDEYADYDVSVPCLADEGIRNPKYFEPLAV